jgi:hypothetical protein
MSVPAGHPKPAPGSFADAGVVHAIDGDRTALCNDGVDLQQVNGFFWVDVPESQRCPTCATIMGDAKNGG